MKRLYLVRHAKSSWSNSTLSDFDRPLNDRGLQDAPFMAGLLKRLYVLPEIILASPARRALTTAHLFAQELGYAKERVETKPELYDSGISQYLDVLAEVEESRLAVMLVGHNPTITSLATYITSIDIDNVPTCGITVVDLDIADWKDTGPDSGTCIAFEYPKKYKTKRG